MKNKKESGQSLLEVIIGLVIGVIVIGGAVITLIASLNSTTETKNIQTASFLLVDTIDKVKSIGESDWPGIYGLSKGASSTYHISYNTSTANFQILNGSEITLGNGGKNFTRYFYVENVNRSQCGLKNSTSAPVSAYCNNPLVWPPADNYVAEDPSTQKITVVVLWNNDRERISQSEYISRTQNKVFQQTDWSGGQGQTSFPLSGSSTLVNDKFESSANIDFNTPGVIKLPVITNNIIIRARGVVGDEAIDFRVNGSVIKAWILSTTYQDYATYASVSPADLITVNFTNDNGPRDVQIDYAIINGVTYPAASQPINTGVWNPGTGSCGGISSQWLHCNGYIQFSI